jgi:hypothetical protein
VKTTIYGPKENRPKRFFVENKKDPKKSNGLKAAMVLKCEG